MRAVDAFSRLAPDQRAAVELVLRGRSYADLAGLLGIPEETVRARARGGLEALAPDLPPPARAGEIADWLLGQGPAPPLDEPGARSWAETVSAALGVQMPAAPVVPPAPAEPAPPVEPPPPAEPPPAPASPGGSSRLGGAILIGAALVAIAVVLAFVLTRGGDDTPAAQAPSATATPAASATGTPQAQAGDIVLKGPAGSKAIGLMRLFRANDNTVRFALAAQDVAPNTGKDTYSIWFEKSGGAARRLGVAQSQVGKDGTLTTAGPRNEDVEKFPEWFASYDTVLVTLDSSPSASKPGKVVLSGDLPHASG